MGITAKEWMKRECKKIADKWMIFLVMVLTALALVLLILPIAMAVVVFSIIYILAASVTAILNQVFYRKPVDETFEDLYERLLSIIFGIVEF